MTSPAAHVGLSYDGTDLQATDLSVFFEIKRGLFETPSVRGDDVTVAALAGRSERNRLNDVLSIVLVGHVTANPMLTDADDARSDFWDKFLGVRTLFAPNRAWADLVATLPNGTIYTISARPLNIITTREIASEFWQGSVELEGIDDWSTGAS